MSDIHQEWRELREKNGNFINHIDGELAKIEKEKKLLDEQKEQIFYDPMTCTYFKADPEEIQKKFESMRKDLTYKSECIDKMIADYSALIVKNANLQKQLDAAQKEVDDFTVMYDKAHAEAHQAKVAKDRMGYSNRCMQSKIAKQANEIKRLAHENVGLVIDMKRYRNEIEKLKQGHWDEMERLQNANAKLEHDNFQLKQALGTSAKDAEVNFNRGRIKGMEEIWYELKDAYDGRPIGENQKIFGCNTVGDMLMNLSPTWFINRAEEYHEQEDKKTKDIQIGDEVEILDPFCPNDNPHSDIGIVIVIDKDNQCFTVIGPKFEGCFDETDIDSGRVRKTGQHFDSIPLNYFA